MLNKFSLNNFLFISFFLIFLHFIPIGVETQPHISLILALVIFFSSIKSYNYVKKDIIFLYLLLVVIFIYALLQIIYQYSLSPLLELTKYFIGPIVYIAIRYSNFSISYKVFRNTLYSLIFLGFINLIFPSIYEFIFGIIIPRFSGNQVGGVRGITILTPEPSYFVIFQIILLITIEKQLSYKHITVAERKYLNILKYLALFLSLFTKSALVLLICIIFLIPSKINFKRFFLLILLIPIIAFLTYTFFSENRLSQIINLLYDLLKEGDFNIVTFLFTQESSGGTRVIVNFLAIASIFINPFGSGLGSFSNMLGFYGAYFGLDISNHEVLGSDSINKIYPQTYFANLCNDIGIFALLLFPIILVNNENSNKAYNLKRNLCLVFMILFQSQITNPAFWYLIAISKISHDQKILK